MTCVWTPLVYHCCVLLHLTYWSVLFWFEVVETICLSSFKSYSAPEMPLPLTPPSPAYSRRSSPGAHVTLIVTPFICTRSEAAEQVDKWAFCCVQAHTHRGVVALSWKWEGGVISSFLWATGCFAWIQEFRTTSPQWEGWLEGSAEITSGDESE